MKHAEGERFYVILAKFENFEDMICIDFNYDVLEKDIQTGDINSFLPERVYAEFEDRINELSDEYGEFEGIDYIEQKELKK